MPTKINIFNALPAPQSKLIKGVKELIGELYEFLKWINIRLSDLNDIDLRLMEEFKTKVRLTPVEKQKFDEKIIQGLTEALKTISNWKFISVDDPFCLKTEAVPFFETNRQKFGNLSKGGVTFMKNLIKNTRNHLKRISKNKVFRKKFDELTKGLKSHCDRSEECYLALSSIYNEIDSSCPDQKKQKLLTEGEISVAELKKSFLIRKYGDNINAMVGELKPRVKSVNDQFHKFWQKTKNCILNNVCIDDDKGDEKQGFSICRKK